MMNLPRAEGPPGVRVLLPETPESLRPAAVRQAIVRGRRALERCAADGLARDPAAWGTVSIRFLVQDSGRAGSVGASRTDPGMDATAQCMAAVVRRGVFPRPGGGRFAIVNQTIEVGPPGSRDRE